MIHEIQLEEVVDTLVSGQPEVSFTVDAHLADEVDTVYNTSDTAVLRKAVQVMGIVYEDVPLAVGTGGYTVIRCQKATGGHEACTVTVYFIDAFGSEKKKLCSVSQKRIRFSHLDG